MGKCKDCIVSLMGVCRDLEYCRQEREWLFAEAVELAEKRGHRLGEFEKLPGVGTWQSECLDCGRKVFVQPNPPTGERQVSGDALTEDETGASEQLLETKQDWPWE